LLVSAPRSMGARVENRRAMRRGWVASRSGELERRDLRRSQHSCGLKKCVKTRRKSE
jgi:hypothetical protein